MLFSERPKHRVIPLDRLAPAPIFFSPPMIFLVRLCGERRGVFCFGHKRDTIGLRCRRLARGKGAKEMAMDMKETIAQAAKTLLMEEGVRKLTVKDIVEACQITRQAFYYHFEDIPALFRWMLEQDAQRTVAQFDVVESGEAWLKYLFVVAINALPYMKKGMQSNYRDQLERLLQEHTQHLFEQVCDQKGLYRSCTRFEVSLILRYHSQAVMGLLRGWTQTDTQNLDAIVHTVFRLMTEGISPLA